MYSKSLYVQVLLSHNVTYLGPERIKFLAVSRPSPERPTISTFILTNLAIVSTPKAPIYLEYKLWSISLSSFSIYIYYWHVFIFKLNLTTMNYLFLFKCNIIFCISWFTNAIDFYSDTLLSFAFVWFLFNFLYNSFSLFCKNVKYSCKSSLPNWFSYDIESFFTFHILLLLSWKIFLRV